MLLQNMFDSKASSVFNSSDRCDNHYTLFSSNSREIWNDPPQPLSRQDSFSSDSTDAHRSLSREPSFSTYSSSLSDPVPHVPSSPVKNLLLYKTELCRSYEESGVCRYGEKCQFAHGMAQLRDIPRHPKYKTQICRTFWDQGSCPYGKRCCFIHAEVDPKTTASTQSGVRWSAAVNSTKSGPSLASPAMMPAKKKDYFNPRAVFLDGFNVKSAEPAESALSLISSRHAMDGLYSRASLQPKSRANNVGDIQQNVREDLARFFWNSKVDQQSRLQVFQNFS